jgi:hypothetical protein
VLLFLDFDGVLRRKTSPPMVFDADCLAKFEQAALALPACDIVVTSSWRDLETITAIRARFSASIAARLVAAVPTVDVGAEFPRHREVLEFLRRRGRSSEPWIGIDDDPRAYPAGCRVVLTDPAVGFDEASARRLVELARANDPRICRPS